MKTPLRRHDLAYVSNGALVRTEGGHPLPPLLQTWLSEWIAAGKPLVVARQKFSPNATPPQIQLGAALPLRLGRAKVACSVAGASLACITPALSIERASGVLPVRERSVLARLSGLAESLGIALGVYGSTAWECLSGESYRRSDSDVDVICDVERRDALEPWLCAMEAAARALEDHLDGEIRFPGGDAVAWRELARAGLVNGETRVLVKSSDGVAFATVGSLLEKLT
jgi:phosphoribosyl-dephospho-CoA transferase